MRKSTKLAILVAALVALCTMAAFAADTWKQEGNDWYCYDKDGNLISGEARKSGDNYYYLDAGTGVMVKNTLVNTGDAIYYYGADGARVIGDWAKVAVENEDDGWEWMYFKTVTGKATVGASTIKSKKYYFDSDGYMLYGYRDSSWTKVSYPSAATYNYGTKDDGSAQTGWVNVKDGADDNFSESASKWFYFNKGEKVVTTIKVNGVRYYFNYTYGDMVTGWAATSAVADSAQVYFGGADEGALKKSQWVKTTNFTDEDTPKWYYLTSNGARHAKGVDKIKGKYYLFNSDLQMVSGVVYGTTTDALDPKGFQLDSKPATLAAFKALPANAIIMYFSADDTDGSMKTGSQTVTIDGEEATVVFDKHGYAYEGYVSKKIYQNGILQSAGDSKVAPKMLRVKYSEDLGIGYYLVNASGTILKDAKAVDSDAIYWVVKGYQDIYKFADKDLASYAATAVKSSTLTQADILAGKVTFTNGGHTYQVVNESAKDGKDGLYYKYRYMNYVLVK